MRNTHQYKINLPTPEEILLNKTYSFTLSLDDTCLMHKHAPKSFPEQYKIYQQKLNLIRHSKIEIITYPEISRNGRLHLHGTIKFLTYLSISEFYLQFLNYPYSIEIDSIDDNKIWDEYILKSKHIMKPLCDKYYLDYRIQTKPILIQNTILESLNEGTPDTDEWEF